MLDGASVRERRGGRRGEVEKLSDTWITIIWQDSIDDSVLGTREKYLRDDAELEQDVEIFTLDREWIPLGWLVASPEVRKDRDKEAQTRADSRYWAGDPWIESSQPVVTACRERVLRAIRRLDSER
jgi:hypothetical protein